MTLKTMILATGIEKLDKAFSAVKGYESVDIVKTKKDLEEIYNFYKVDTSNIVVIYDDIDLDVGKIRIRKKGSGGTHNGMRSIVKCLGTTDFPRVRVGVSKPEPGRDLANFVLSRFSKDEEVDLKDGFDKAVKAIDCIIREDIDLSMNKFNGK